MKNKIIFIIMLLIIIILSISLLCTYKQLSNTTKSSPLDIVANSKFHPNPYTEDELQRFTHVLINYGNNNNINQAMMLYTFDEYDNCVSIRLYYDFKTVEDAEIELKNKSNNTRPEINGNILTFSSPYTKITKRELLSSMNSNMDYIIF